MVVRSTESSDQEPNGASCGSQCQLQRQLCKERKKEKSQSRTTWFTTAPPRRCWRTCCHTHTHKLEILSDSFIYFFYLFSRRKNTHKGHEAVEMILSVLRKSDWGVQNQERHRSPSSPPAVCPSEPFTALMERLHGDGGAVLQWVFFNPQWPGPGQTVPGRPRNTSPHWGQCWSPAGKTNKCLTSQKLNETVGKRTEQKTEDQNIRQNLILSRKSKNHQ